MAIDIQRLLDHPTAYLSEAWRRLAPRGWNSNTQFFLIFLAVLGVHLVAMPALMRSAGVREPGDPQGYFTSTPDGSPTVASGAAEATSSPKSAPAAAESLKISDAPLIADPLDDEPDPESKPMRSESKETAPSRPPSAPLIAEPLKMPIDPAAELLAAIDAAEESQKSDQTREPSLNDLVTEVSPEEPNDPPAAAPDPDESAGLRTFRSLR